jgi:hypothetical protein
MTEELLPTALVRERRRVTTRMGPGPDNLEDVTMRAVMILFVCVTLYIVNTV